MNSLTDYTQTQRIVLLIDLNPLLSVHSDTGSDPDTELRKAYTTQLSNSIKLLLTFPSLSSSLFSLIPFFSSLSPLLSSSLLNSPNHLSFTTPHQTLTHLHTLLTHSFTLRSRTPALATSRALNVAASMRELLYDYAWDLDAEGCNFSGLGVQLRSSLVVLFSPVGDDFCGFRDVVEDEGLFLERFSGVFKDVYGKFVDRDIHFSWVDVRFGFAESVGKWLKVFEKGVKGFGWGFCSSEAMVLGSALVPFGLFYPEIGVLWNLEGQDKCRKKGRGQLDLEIMDVNGKPLDCKCCGLELVDLKELSKGKCDDGFGGQDMVSQRIEVLDLVGDGSVKVIVKAVQRNDELPRLEGKFCDPVLVRELAKEGVKDQKGSFGGFTDRVLEFLEKDLGALEERKEMPIWQMFLSFLYREGYWALVVLSNGSNNTCVGVLKPFTFSLALLSVIDPQYTIPSNPICAPSSYKKHGTPGDRKTKKTKRDLKFYQDLNWSAFYDAAFALTEVGLDEIFFAAVGNSSKKLKFLKCWMKQISKSSYCSINITEGSKTGKILRKDVEDRQTGLQQPINRLTELQQESEQPIFSSASAGENSFTEPSRIQAEAAPDDCLGTKESFFSSLSGKMQQAIKSDGIDLAAFAERIVNSSIYWLHRRHESEAKTESQHMELKSDDSFSSGANELIKLLLMEPKDLASKYNNDDLSLQASDVGSGGNGSENIVREYELQILVRFEILRLEALTNTSESFKQKFVKQICLLLENIQFHMEGDFFADWSLGDYVEKTIKARYADTLEDVVLKIYNKMDLLLFEDKTDDMPINSCESNQSWKEKGEKDDVDVRSSDSVSAAHCSVHVPGDERVTPKARDEQSRRLIEAQERREKAKRVRSFTSWMPDLQRVPQKAIKAKLHHPQKISRRKKQPRAYDIVCETPRSGRHGCPFSQWNSSDDDDHLEDGNYLCQ